MSAGKKRGHHSSAAHSSPPPPRSDSPLHTSADALSGNAMAFDTPEACQNRQADKVVLLEGTLSKCVIFQSCMEWKDRHVTLTDQHIYISNEKNGVIRDFLHLRDLTTIERLTPSSGSRPAALKKKRSLFARSGPHLSRSGLPSTEPPDPEHHLHHHRHAHTRATGEIGREDSDSESDPLPGSHSGSHSDPLPNAEKSPVPIDQVEFKHVIEIFSETYGRTYHLRASSAEECDRWCE